MYEYLCVNNAWNILSLNLSRRLLLIMGSASEVTDAAYRPWDMGLYATSNDHGHQLRHNLCLLCEFAQRQKIFNSVLYTAVSTNIAQLW
jgi:hypothetical protein